MLEDYIKEYLTMIDSAVKLFGGDMTFSDILNMPIEEFKDFFDIRSEQRKKSLERYRKTGEKDLYIGAQDSNEQMMELLASLLVSNAEISGRMPVDPRRIKFQDKNRKTMGQKEFWATNGRGYSKPPTNNNDKK